MTLTFDLLTSKRIRVIYWQWPIFLPSRMTVINKLFKKLSLHGFCIKCHNDLVLWPSDIKLYKGHLLSMTNPPTKYHDCHLETFQEIKRTWFLQKMPIWPWPSDLKMYRGHLMSMTYPPTKYHATQKLFKILSGNGFCLKCYCDLDI